MAKPKKEANQFIKVKNKRYELISRRYDAIYGCYFYYVKEQDEPFCDIDNDIEIVDTEWRGKD